MFTPSLNKELSKVSVRSIMLNCSYDKKPAPSASQYTVSGRRESPQYENWGGLCEGKRCIVSIKTQWSFSLVICVQEPPPSRRSSSLVPSPVGWYCEKWDTRQGEASRLFSEANWNDALQNKSDSGKYNLGIEHSWTNLIVYFFKSDNHLEAVITTAMANRFWWEN